MAQYIQNTGLNNLERGRGCAVFKLDTTAKNGARAEDGLVYADGDEIIIGTLPAKCNVDDIRMNIFSGYVAGTTIDIGFIGRIGDEYTGFTPIATGIVIDKSTRTVVIPMPTDGNVNPDDTLYTGDRGSIWSGEDGVHIAAIIHPGAGMLASQPSNLQFCFSYSYFGTKQSGGYLR